MAESGTGSGRRPDAIAFAESRIGTTVAGKYRLERLLGLGGMGVVFEACHTYTDRRVALKLLHQAVAHTPTAKKRFLAEAKAVAPIRHPAIVEVLDGGEEPDGTLYLVFELLVGRDLASLLKGGPVTHESLVPLILQVLDVLGALHATGLVHRDIKPENMFLTLDGEGRFKVKLLDFGIARRITGQVGDGITAVGAVVGTPNYMSPEQLVGEAIDGQTDLWSVGVVMYRALAGRLPFDGSSVEQLVRGVFVEGAKPLASLRPDLPEALLAVVDRALLGDRAERWPTAAAMAEALRSATPGAVPSALPLPFGHAGASLPAERVLGVGAAAEPARSVPGMAHEAPTQPAASAAPRPSVAAKPGRPAPPDRPEPRPSWEAALDEIQGETDRLKSKSVPPRPSVTPTTEATAADQPRSLFGKLFRR